MLNKQFFEWLMKLASYEPFIRTIDQTEYALQRQIAAELVLRFVAFRAIPYNGRWDVHEYLDDALINVAQDERFDLDREALVFRETFSLLADAQGDKAFKRWDGVSFTGKFLMSVFEVIGTGVATHIESIKKLPNPAQFVVLRSKELWENENFNRHSGAGVRGTTRLSHLIPLAKEFFQP